MRRGTGFGSGEVETGQAVTDVNPRTPFLENWGQSLERRWLSCSHVLGYREFAK